MTESDVVSLLQRVAVAAEQLNRGCEHAQQDLHQYVQSAPDMMRQSLEEQLRNVTNEITAGVNQGLGQSLTVCEQRLRQAGDGAKDATQVLAAQARNVEALHRHLVWKVSGVVLAALVLVLGGAIWLSMYYAGIVRDNQISAELLKAYNQADVTLCGNRLCAKIGKKYVPVELR